MCRSPRGWREQRGAAVSLMSSFLSFSLCPPGLQFEGPDAPVYEVSPSPSPSLHLVSCPHSLNCGCSQPLTESLSRFKVRHEPKEGGDGRVCRKRNF